jgi:hypothetical protein
MLEQGRAREPERMAGISTLAGTIVALVTALFITLIGLLLTAVLASLRLSASISRARRSAREHAGMVHVLYQGPLSAEVWARSARLRALGFEPLATDDHPGRELVIMFRPHDSVIAEVLRWRAPSPDSCETSIELTSVMAGRTALLCTSTDGCRPPSRIPGELRQVLPNDPPAELVAGHAAALSYLAEAGISAEPLDRSEVLDVRAEWLRQGLRVLERTRLEDVVRQAQAVARHGHPELGPLQDQAQLEPRLAALRVAPSAASRYDPERPKGNDARGS